MRRALVLLALAANPALAQSANPHAGHHMPGMDHGAESPSQANNDAPAEDDADMAGMDMFGLDQPEQSEADGPARGTDQPAGKAKAPAVVHDRIGDRYWDPAAMARAVEAEMHPPRPAYAKLTFDLAEWRAQRGRNGYAWEAEGWIGDLDRVILKSRGEGTFSGGFAHGELDLLYGKALDPWWNLQAGLRQDLGPGPQRSWAAIGIEGRAPYQFEVQAAAFVSDKGDVTARAEAAYDQRITQHLILQPRLSLDLAAQDMPLQQIGAGLSEVEFGLRLRREVVRELAPYLGVNWTWKLGQSAAYARAAGDSVAERSVVAGVRFWF